MFCERHQSPFHLFDGCKWCQFEAEVVSGLARGEHVDVAAPAIEAIAPVSELELYQEAVEVGIKRKQIQQGHNMRWKKEW
jgi:hypothetical protein